MYRLFFQIAVFIAVIQIGFTGVSFAQSEPDTLDTEKAQESNPYFNNSGLPLPRFISFSSNKVFMRTGPGLRYPIRWIYTKKGLPIEVMQEFDTWRKIRDYEGEEGWVHQSLLSGKRTAIVQTEKNKPAALMKKPDLMAKPVAMIESKVVIPLEECGKDWCKTEIQGFDGWIEKKFIWGVYAGSEFD